MKHYIFYYFMNGDIEAIRASAPLHAAYWQNQMQLGGPFADFKGGFIIFPANGEAEALDKVQHDPFITTNVLSDYWLKEWLEKK